MSHAIDRLPLTLNFERTSRQNRAINPMDKSCFWAASGGVIAVWVLLGLSALMGFKLTWLLICVFAISMGCTNFCGYMYCKPDVMNDMSNMAKQKMGEAAMNHALGNLRQTGSTSSV